MSTDYRWEWSLPNGVKVAATLDASMQLESVFVGERLASQAARGTKPEGHVLSEPTGVVVTFQRGALICILRRDGEEVTPNTWPVRKRAEQPKPRIAAVSVGAAGAVLSVALAIGGIFALRGRAAGDGERSAVMTGVHRADNGRFVAHFPASFTTRRALVPSGMSGVVLEDPVRSDVIVLVALASGDVPREPWLLHQKLHGEALVNLPRGGAGHDPISRSDETCVGNPGAVVTGRVKNAHGEPAFVWSCAFVHDGAGYLAMYAVREAATSEDAKRLRQIVEATELTHLAGIDPSH